MATKKEILTTIVEEINNWFDEQADLILPEIKIKLEESRSCEEQKESLEEEEQYEYGDCDCCGGSGMVYEDSSYKEQCWECEGKGFKKREIEQNER